MKKLFSILLCLAMLFSLAACGEKGKVEDNKGAEGNGQAEENKGPEEGKEPEASPYKVAMVTDYGDITDQSFNQTTYEACKDFCEKNNIEFTYKKPADNNTEARVAMIDNAIDEGYNIIVTPGFAFADAVYTAAKEYKDIKFVPLDIGLGDWLAAAVTAAGESYSWNPDDYKLEDYMDFSNIYCIIYQEELCGYQAGYAAVKLGYTKLGFLGGMAVPAVVRYGYGFVQGADAAAKETGAAVSVKYAYGNQFFGDADITAVMDTWYGGGTEVVFACGGGIYTSAAEAAAKVGGKVIGVDVDQAPIIDGAYGEGMTVTSAMKGLYPSTYDTLDAIVNGGKWDEMKGQIVNLGLVSGNNVDLDYVGLPTKSTQFSDKFTKDDLQALAAKMYSGEIKVDNDVSKTVSDFAKNITVEDLGNIK